MFDFRVRSAVSSALVLLSVVGCLGPLAGHSVGIAFAESPLALDRLNTAQTDGSFKSHYREGLRDTGRLPQPESTTVDTASRKVMVGQRRLQQYFSWLNPRGSMYQPYAGWEAEPSSYTGAQTAASQRYWRDWGWLTPWNVEPAEDDISGTAATTGLVDAESETSAAAPGVRQQNRQTTQPEAQQQTQQPSQQMQTKVDPNQKQPSSTDPQQAASVQQAGKPSTAAQAVSERQTTRRNRNGRPWNPAAVTATPSVSAASTQPHVASIQPPEAPSAIKPAQYCMSATRGMQFNVLAAGDSITQGSVPSRNLNHPYTLKLKELLRRRLGKNADAVTAGLGGGGIFMEGFSNPIRFAPFYLNYLNQVEWNIAVISIGINDLLRGGHSATDIMAGLQPLFDQTLAKGIPVIAIPAFAAPGFVSQSDPKEAQRQRLAMLIVEAAEKRQAATDGQGPQIYALDLQAGPMDFWKMSNEERSRYLDDGLHMTEFAYDMIGQYVYETVNALFCSVENPTVTLPGPHKP